MIRALRPTDVLAYLTFQNLLPLVRADPTGRTVPRSVGVVPLVASFFGRSLALEAGRETWVQIDNGRISGLIASKRREGADIWDVDQLAVLPSADSSRTASRLLEQLLSAAVDEGIHKVFLRLDEGDPAQDWVRQVGFFQYCQETTYFHPEVPRFAHPVIDQRIRRRRPSDHHALFQLYCSAVPFRVRQAEGMTLHEWRWTDGWAVRPPGLASIIGTSRSDFVLDLDSRAVAWIQVEQTRRRLSILSDENLDVPESDLVAFSLIRLGAGGPASCAVRDYQSGLACALEENNFQVCRAETLYARALASRVPEVALVPVRAS